MKVSSGGRMSVTKQWAFLLTVVFLTAAMPAPCKPAPPDEVRWLSTMEEASAAAKESGRPILVDFWADWCAACKIMDKEVYSDPAFVAAAHNFVAVRVNYDKKTALARKYNVSELPTLVFTDSFGGEIFRHAGYLDGHLLTELLLSLPADVSEFNRLDQILTQNKSDFHALEGMGTKLRAAGLFLTSNDYYGKALDTKEAKAEPTEREAILVEMGANSLALRDGKQAADTFEKCLKEFPNSPQSVAWTLGLGSAYALEDKKDRARKILEALVHEHPDTAEAYKAQALLGAM
jgi:thioredoxin-like negative regulator of GroEL